MTLQETLNLKKTKRFFPPTFLFRLQYVKIKYKIIIKADTKSVFSWTCYQVGTKGPVLHYTCIVNGTPTLNQFIHSRFKTDLFSKLDNWKSYLDKEDQTTSKEDIFQWKFPGALNQTLTEIHNPVFNVHTYTTSAYMYSCKCKSCNICDYNRDLMTCQGGHQVSAFSHVFMLNSLLRWFKSKESHAACKSIRFIRVSVIRSVPQIFLDIDWPGLVIKVGFWLSDFCWRFRATRKCSTAELQ